MVNKINVLVFPAGEINSIELHDALAACTDINIFGASSIERHGRFLFKNYTGGLPLITENNFFIEFNKVINQNRIDVVFPTHDTVALFLADNSNKFSAKLISGDKVTSQICRSKKKTYQLFKNFDFTPKVFNTKTGIMEFPVFAKPDDGQGAVGSVRIDNIDSLMHIDLASYIITEYLPGKELTVDCITDKNGKLKFISPRTRDRVMAGVSVAGKTEPLTGEIEEIASTINLKLKLLGLWFFQVKQDITGKYKLLEISTRCAGSMGLTRARGVNLPLLSVYSAMGYDISVFANPYSVSMDRTLISRYLIDYDYDRVYFCLEGTLIIDNKVNLNAIRFLYQCKNESKYLYLFAKHEKDLEVILSQHSIPVSLFNEVIYLEPEKNKINFIRPERSIFISNSFIERKIVHDKLAIPVFDIAGIEVLLDYRL